MVPTALVILLAVISSADSREPAASADPMAVSLVQLIAMPERYEGKRVRIKGFCHLEFEEQSLYLHREDSDLMNTLNGVWLDIDFAKPKEADFNERFVLVEGVFTGKSRGHLGAWSGTIGEITRFERELTRSEFELVRQLSAKQTGPR